MEIEITSQKENKLLERTEIYFKVKHDKEKTPAREEVRAKLADALGAKKDTVLIDKMRSVFGQQLTQGYAKAYKTIDQAKKIEQEHVLTRNKMVTKKTKEEKKEEKKEERGGEAKVEKKEAQKPEK